MPETENKLDPMSALFFENEEQQQEQEQNNEQQNEQQDQEQQNGETAEQIAEREKAEREESERIEREKQQGQEKQQIEQPRNWSDNLTPEQRAIYEKLQKGEDGQKEVWETLHDKFAPKSWDAEKKLVAYLAAKNPALDENDILFMAAEQYGIGVDPLPDEDLTDEQKVAIRRQGIARKSAEAEADGFFNERAAKIELPPLPDPLENDEGYKEYQQYKAAETQRQEQQQAADAAYATAIQTLETTAKKIDSLEINEKITIDDSELDVTVNFKLDDKKKQQLAEYSKQYVPSKAEQDMFTTKGGESDVDGYMKYLAQKLFSREIFQSGVKQAIAKDRERFVETELHNSSLRNNNVSQPDNNAPKEIWEYAMGRTNKN